MYSRDLFLKKSAKAPAVPDGKRLRYLKPFPVPENGHASFYAGVPVKEINFKCLNFWQKKLP